MIDALRYALDAFIFGGWRRGASVVRSAVGSTGVTVDRRPGDRAEGYLLPKTVIYKKVEETLESPATGTIVEIVVPEGETVEVRGRDHLRRRRYSRPTGGCRRGS